MSGNGEHVDAITAVEDTVSEIVHDVEEIFSPRPNGMVQRHRAERERREAAEKERENIQNRVEEASYKAVKVAQIMPNVTKSGQVNIPTLGNAQILPLAPYRYRAYVRVVTAASSVILAATPGDAVSGIGFPLATGDQPFLVNSRAQVYAFNPGGTTVAVAFFSEMYEPEK